jgi:hypothetical protein
VDDEEQRCPMISNVAILAMTQSLTLPDLRLAIREALVNLEAVRTAAPSIVAAAHLAEIIRSLEALAISLEPVPAKPKWMQTA